MTSLTDDHPYPLCEVQTTKKTYFVSNIFWNVVNSNISQFNEANWIVILELLYKQTNKQEADFEWRKYNSIFILIYSSNCFFLHSLLVHELHNNNKTPVIMCEEINPFLCYNYITYRVSFSVSDLCWNPKWSSSKNVNQKHSRNAFQFILFHRKKKKINKNIDVVKDRWRGFVIISPTEHLPKVKS